MILLLGRRRKLTSADRARLVAVPERASLTGVKALFPEDAMAYTRPKAKNPPTIAKLI